MDDAALRSAPVRSSRAGREAGGRAGAVVLAAGLAAWIAPPLLALARTSWSTEAGALGPLVLATGAWMLIREMRRSRELRPGPGGWLPTLALLALAVLLYVPALAIGMATLLCMAAWVGLIAVLYGLGGGALLRGCWFPLAYLLLLVPLPFGATLAITTALRGWQAVHAVSLASLLGMEVAVDGNAVFVDQYRLAVEAACAGLGSTVSLLSVGMLYAYLLRGAGVARIALVIAAAIPIAMVANLLRILLLLVAVHLAGSDVLATPIHPLSGFVSFTLAFALLAGLDRAAQPLWRRAR